ncbi:hypothetical protein C8R42DRAFT_648363 [Lentinula raphanica]|nr:hypothetical protein C8R42DRAFT_648363 [Lentinula raphanica]
MWDVPMDVGCSMWDVPMDVGCPYGLGCPMCWDIPMAWDILFLMSGTSPHLNSGIYFIKTIWRTQKYSLWAGYIMIFCDLTVHCSNHNAYTHVIVGMFVPHTVRPPEVLYRISVVPHTVRPPEYILILTRFRQVMGPALTL